MIGYKSVVFERLSCSNSRDETRSPLCEKGYYAMGSEHFVKLFVCILFLIYTSRRVPMFLLSGWICIYLIGSSLKLPTPACRLWTTAAQFVQQPQKSFLDLFTGTQIKLLSNITCTVSELIMFI